VVAWSAYNSSTSQGNTNKLNQQGAALVILQAEVQQLVNFDTNQTRLSQQSSAVLNQFFVGFIAEQNYLCRIAASRAVQSGLEAPKPGVCDVTLGPRTPAPSPTPP
jgi:hypothetical protein